MKRIALEWIARAEGDFATVVRESRARVRHMFSRRAVRGEAPEGPACGDRR